MRKIIAPILSVFALVGIVGAAFVLTPQSRVASVHAASGVTSQNLGYYDSVTVPLENLIVNNLQYDYPEPYVCSQPGCLVVHLTGATLLRFKFDNGTTTQEISYQIWERKGGIVVPLSDITPTAYGSWTYDIYYGNYEYDDLLTFTDTSNGLVVTQNVNSPNKNVFSEVTVYTYQSSVTIQAGSFTPTEFTVIFKTIDGEILATIQTVGRYIPSELIPNAPQIDKRPFLRWTNIQGFAVDEIITSDIVFLPLYSYDPNFTITDPTDTDPQDNENENFFANLFADKGTSIALGSIGGLLVLVLLISIIKGGRR